MGNKKRKLNETENAGKQHRINWEYQENKKYDDMEIALNDSILFQWEYTRNIWKFANKKAFDEDDFDTFCAEELCGSNYNKFVWKPKETGTYYLGCQVADCSKTGKMKICINVNAANPTKKQNVE